MVNKKPGPDYKTYFLLGLNIPRGDLSPAPVPKIEEEEKDCFNDYHKTESAI